MSSCYLFWPSVYPLDSTGYLLGWKQHTLLCVATLIPNNKVCSSINSTDQPSIPQTKHIHHHHSQPPRILGQILPADQSAKTEQRHPNHISLIYTSGTLQVIGSSLKLIVVIYDRPSMRKHHFLSLRPLLKPSLFSNQLSSSTSSPTSRKNSTLIQNIKSFETLYPHHSLPNGTDENTNEDMSQLINFINSSQEIHDQIHHSSTSPRSQSIQTMSKNSNDNFSCNLLNSRLAPILALSTFLQQLNVRLVEISSWPTRYKKITQEKDTDLSGRRAEYVMLFNTLWLISNDIIFGRASGTILMANSQYLSDWLEYHLTTYTVILVKKALIWTNSYPVGLKLNDQLGQAFCNLSHMAVDFWHKFFLKYAFSSLPQFIWIVGVISFLGNTFTLAIASDFLTISTFHLYIIYRLFTFIFNCQLKFLSVLFNIFRGRKYNALRKRNEPATYQLDQLILGTILFTLAIFLFPTVLAFYILMSSARVLIIWIHGIIGTGLCLLNHFPLFVLMLRLKDPARLPAGVSFVPSNNKTGIHFKLRNVPVGLSWIFADYISLWVTLSSHYSPQLLFYHLSSGKPIAPLTKL